MLKLQLRFLNLKITLIMYSTSNNTNNNVHLHALNKQTDILKHVYGY